MAPCLGLSRLSSAPTLRPQFRLVVDAYEPHLANLNDGEPAGHCYSQRPAPARGCVSTVARSPSAGQELPRDEEISAHWVSTLQGAEACRKKRSRNGQPRDPI